MRIIAGEFRSRRLVAPTGLATRPTIDRVREALFSMLGPMGGEIVLDLFAGTGALGLEALSRGAAHATFVESHRPALQALRTNIATLQVQERCTVLPASVEKLAWEQLPAATLIFCDPPWDQVDAVVSTVAKRGPRTPFAADARFVLEHPADWVPQEAIGKHERHFDLVVSRFGGCFRQRHWGDTGVTVFGEEG